MEQVPLGPVQPQGLVLNRDHGVPEHPFGRQGLQPLPEEGQAPALRLSQPGLEASQPLEQLRLVRRRHLRGVGGGGGPGVGHEVRDGHIRLVAHGGDDGDVRVVDGPGHPFIVERPQVLDGPAAPAGNDQVRHMVAAGVADGADDLRRGLRPLDPDGQQLHLGGGPPPAQNPDHVVDRRPGGGGDDGDGLRVPGQRLLVPLVKEALPPELVLELLKGQMEVTHPVGAQGVAVELVGPVPGIYGDPPQGYDLHAVLRAEPQAQGLSPEHDAADGPLRVLQRKIVVAGGVELVVGDLPPDVDVPQLGDAVQNALDEQVHLGHLVDMLFHFSSPSGGAR